MDHADLVSGLRPNGRLRAVVATALIYLALVAGLVVQRSDPAFGARFGQNQVHVLLLGLSLFGIALLGRGAIRETFGRRPSAGWIAIALGVALVALAVSHAWVRAVLPETSSASRGTSLWWHAALLALFVAYSEELLFRGVLWAALARRSSTWLRPLLQTSALFAIAHVIGPAGIAEVPHRAVAGLLLGLLRAKSQSLWPAVHAHFCLDLIVFTT